MLNKKWGGKEITSETTKSFLARKYAAQKFKNV